jgi:hypothetical protein
MNNISLLSYLIENRKITGATVMSPDGETKFLDIKEYKNLIENTGSKISVRFPNESFFEEVSIDLEKFEVSNEFPHEIFGWYDGTAISIKK